MMIGALPSSSTIQITTVSVGSDYCCNDPACNCKGGREAKQALERAQAQRDEDQVSVSAAGLALLRNEALAPAAAPTITAAVAPAGKSAALTDSTTYTAPAERARGIAGASHVGNTLLPTAQAPANPISAAEKTTDRPSNTPSLPNATNVAALAAYQAAEQKRDARPLTIDIYA